MKRKHFILFLTATLLPFSLQAQPGVSLTFGTGFNFFQTGSFADLELSYSNHWKPAGYQSSVSNPLGKGVLAGFTITLEDSSWLFPSFYTEGFSHVHSLGIADYSGEIRVTTELSGIHSGFGFSCPVYFNTVFFHLRTGVVGVFQNSYESFSSKTGDNPQNPRIPARKKGRFLLGAIEPGLSYDLKLLKGLTFSSEAAYLITTVSESNVPFQGSDMVSQNYQSIHINFTGFRLKTGIKVTFSDYF